ncbi:MAG: UDP-N-acetylglucosamine 1-carboxyvinyltransferase [Clostridiales bacterium]|nr:UDP-N-acetylglucosamine 1-carboxyvinyltransferase [Clostridiales bacterium]
MSSTIVVHGQKKLSGEVFISGAKNSAVAILASCIIANDKCILENLPDIEDVRIMIKALKEIGARCVFKNKNKNKMEIDTHSVNSSELLFEYLNQMRASYYFVGALLSRFKQAKVILPGGCAFSVRPIDQHIKAIEAIGAEMSIEHGAIDVKAIKLAGKIIFFDVISVGATINAMLASVRAEGITILKNAAKEPHVVDTANFLNKIGAEIKGAGTDEIKIIGKKSFHGTEYCIMPDPIEAGTYMISAAITRSQICIKNVISKHLESLSAKLRETNCEIETGNDYIKVDAYEKDLIGTNIKTMSYPGFPTDLQPQMTAYLATTKNTSIVTDSIWFDRFQYINELKKFGADIKFENGVAIVNGVKKLSSAQVCACDLRAGAALIIAGIASDGVTHISNSQYIDRGYENIIGKFKNLGVNIKRSQKKI